MNLSHLKQKILDLFSEIEKDERPVISDDIKTKMASEKFKTLTLSTPLEKTVTMAAAGRRQMQIRGIATTNSLDRDGQRVDVKGAKIIGANNRLPMFANHDPARTVGSWVKWSYNEQGQLVVEGVIKEFYDPVIFEQVLSGDVSGLSIGFLVNDYAEGLQGEVVFTDTEIVEVSVVAVPSNRDAVIQITAEEKSPDNVVTKSAGSEEKIEPPTSENPTTGENEEAAPVTETTAETIPEVPVEPTLEEKLQKLQDENNALRGENEQLKLEANEMKADLEEADSLIAEVAGTIDQLREEKELKYEIKK